jgi:hypothetical protein
MLPLALACASTPAPAPQSPAPVATPVVASVTAPVAAPAPSGGTLSLRLDPGAPFTAAEVLCPSGLRQRAAITDGTATIDGLPAESCAINFKGGPPAMFTPITAGSWSCSYVGTTMSCSLR